MPASNEQVQTYVDARIRPLAERARDLLIDFQDELATIEDVYQNLNGTPNWTDSRSDNPPHLLTAGDVLGIHAFIFDIEAAMSAHGQLPVVRKACVRET